MSPLEAVREVLSSNLPSTVRLVLVAWSDHVGAEGTAWPGNSRLVKRTGLSERAVRDAMKLARSLGVLVTVGESERGTTIDRLDLATLAAVPRQDVPPGRRRQGAPAAPPPGTSCPTPGQDVPHPPAPAAPEEAIEEAIEDTRPAAPLTLFNPTEKQPDDWAQLREHFASFPWTKTPKDRSKGAGLHLVKLLDACEDLQTAKTVLDWWAWADTPRARQLRTGDSKGSESDAAPVYGLPTLTTSKNVDEYITQATSWARQRNPPRRKLSTDAPALRSLSIPEQRARDVISDEPTPIQRKLAEQAAKRAKEKP